MVGEATVFQYRWQTEPDRYFTRTVLVADIGRDTANRHVWCPICADMIFFISRKIIILKKKNKLSWVSSHVTDANILNLLHIFVCTSTVISIFFNSLYRRQKISQAYPIKVELSWLWSFFYCTLTLNAPAGNIVVIRHIFFTESGLRLIFKPAVTSVIVVSSNSRCHLMFLSQRLKALACNQR